MSERTPIHIQVFGGINKSHTRELGQPSEGKNFWTRGGALYSRQGLKQLVTPGGPVNFGGPVNSLFSCKEAQVTERLIAQVQGDLYHSLLPSFEDFTLIQGGLSGYGHGNVYREHLIMSFGLQVLFYNVMSGVLSGDLTNVGAPMCKFTSTWRDYLWTVPGGSFAPSYQLQFNGYQYEPIDPAFPDDPPKIIDRDITVWPENHNIKIHDGTGVMGAIPFGSQLIIITEFGTWHLYGNNEDDFELIKGSTIGALYSLFNVCALVADHPVWIGTDRKIYMFTGSVVEHISGPVDELMMQEKSKGILYYPRVYGFGQQLWIIIVKNLGLEQEPLNTTTAYVYDAQEGQWYVHEFGCHILSACMYDNKIHFGLKDGRIVYMDPSAVDAEGNPTDLDGPVTTEFTVGPINIQSRRMKIKSANVMAEPYHDFALTIHSQIGQEGGVEQGAVEFSQGGQDTQRVKFASLKGKDLTLRFSSTDKIDELQSMTLVTTLKDVK